MDIREQDVIDFGLAASDLEEHLLEAYQLEYILGELSRRKKINPALSFGLMGRRIEGWQDRLQSHALSLMKRIAQQLLFAYTNWLSHHTGPGFAEEILETEEDFNAIDLEGKLSWGFSRDRGAFTYNLTDDLIECIIQDQTFIDAAYDEIMADEDEENLLVDPPENTPEYRKEIVREFMEMYEYPMLLNIAENNGIKEQCLKNILTEKVFPLWRQFWSGLIEKPENDARNAITMLQKAIESNDLSDLFVAVNVALQVRHVHGNMASDHADISPIILDELSSLDTEPLDEFVDKITGENWKKRSSVVVLFNGPRFTTAALKRISRDGSRTPSYIYKFAFSASKKRKT